MAALPYPSGTASLPVMGHAPSFYGVEISAAFSCHTVGL